MKDNKIINVNDLYYATLIDKDGIPKCLLGIYKNGVFIDIKNDDRYVRDKKTLKFSINNVPVNLYDFLNFIFATEDLYYGKRRARNRTVKEILEKDKYIIKTFIECEKTFDYNNSLKEQQTLAIIKPDGVKNAIKIIEMIYKSGLSIEKYEVRMLDKEILSEHYSHLLDKPFYPVLENYMLSGEVILMILKGKNAVEKLRNLMGPTDSTKAPKGTIRGEFGTDITYNAIHGSDSYTNAQREINRFFYQKQKRI